MNATDTVIPRYLVLVDGEQHGGEHESEDAAIAAGEQRVRDADNAPVGSRYMTRAVEVVRSVRRWELDVDSGDMLEVGEKVVQPAR